MVFPGELYSRICKMQQLGTVGKGSVWPVALLTLLWGMKVHSRKELRLGISPAEGKEVLFSIYTSGST
jgi:hypothetical protein